MRIDIGIRNWLYRINIGTRNWLYRLIKWWVEGNRKFKEIEIDAIGFRITQDVFNGAGISGNIKIRVAKTYLKEEDILKYISEEGTKIMIGYWEGEPLRSEYRWRDTMTKKDWKRLDELFAIPLKERTKKEEVERDKLFDKTREI